MASRLTGSDSAARATPARIGSTLKRTAKKFHADGMTDWAAALTYYALLSLFPAAIAMVSLIGLFGDPETTTDALTDILTEVAPESATDTFASQIESITSNSGAAGVAFVFGLVAALWSASGYVGAFFRASNVIYDAEESRGFLKLRPLQIGVTVAMIAIMIVLAVGLVMTGSIVRAVADPIGLGDTAVNLWNYGKWPVMVALFVLAISVLFYASPDVNERSFKQTMPGSMVALVAAVIASAGFAFYVANFGSYGETYGALGGLVALLVWFWITNLAILFGQELNRERARSLDSVADTDDDPLSAG